MKILCLSDSTLIGGAEAQILDLLRGIADAGHEIRLLCCGRSFAEAARSRGLRGDALGLRFRHPLGFGRGVRAVRSILTLEAPHVLHAEGVAATVVAGLARLRTQRPPGLVSTVHNVTDPAPWSYGLAARLIRLSGAYLTTVSESERSRYLRRGFPAERSRTVYNGVEIRPVPAAEVRGRVRSALGLPHDALVLLHVGRLSREKGHSVLFEALEEMESLGDSAVRLLCAGDGPLRTALEAERIRRGLADRVVFLGFRQDVPDLMAASDLLVLPSLAEAFPMVLLEAMVIGLPVIASRVGGVGELITDGREGWLVRAGDPAALREALIRALGDDKVRLERSRAARERVSSRFSHRRMVEETLDVYFRVARPRSRTETP